MICPEPVVEVQTGSDSQPYDPPILCCGLSKTDCSLARASLSLLADLCYLCHSSFGYIASRKELYNRHAPDFIVGLFFSREWRLLTSLPLVICWSNVDFKHCAVKLCDCVRTMKKKINLIRDKNLSKARKMCWGVQSVYDIAMKLF